MQGGKGNFKPGLSTQSSNVPMCSKVEMSPWRSAAARGRRLTSRGGAAGGPLVGKWGAVIAPGVVSGWLGGLLFLVSGFNRRGDEFAGHDFRLAALLLVEAIGELAALILDGELASGVFQHQDFGAAKGACAARLLELVDQLVMLQGQV